MPITGEAGWTPDQWGHSRFRTLGGSTDIATNLKHLTAFMRTLLKASNLMLHLDSNFHSLIFFSEVIENSAKKH
jgi:hypothetical protein